MFGVFITRAQPLHNGHLEVIRKMEKECKECMVIIGSADKSGTDRNPLDIEQRVRAVRSVMKGYITGAHDADEDDEAWKQRIIRTVRMMARDDEVALYGHMKEDTGYLKWFPQWGYVEVDTVVKYDCDIVRAHAEEGNWATVAACVPKESFLALAGHWYDKYSGND